jgi:hypothetical protein
MSNNDPMPNEKPNVQQNTVDVELLGHRDTNEVPKKHRSRSLKIFGILLIAVAVFLYARMNSPDSKDSDAAYNELQLARAAAFDERLIACKDISSAQPSQAFEKCLDAAKDGVVLAIKRIVWAYSRNNEYQDLGKVFEWLRAVPYKNDATQLLMFSLVHLNAGSDGLRKDSEVGISRLVAKNYAPANIVLASIYALQENLLPPTSNTLWLLEKGNKKDPVVLSPAQLALIHANGLVAAENIAAGTKILKESAQRDFPIATNNIAWFLSTLDSNPFTPPDYAITLAQRVVDDPNHGTNPIYIDTLAATLAANKMFAEAVETQQRAIKLVEQSELQAPAKEVTINEYTERLALYMQNEVLIEDTLMIEKSTFFKNIRNRVLQYVLNDFYIPIEIPALWKSTDADLAMSASDTLISDDNSEAQQTESDAVSESLCEVGVDKECELSEGLQ